MIGVVSRRPSAVRRLGRDRGVVQVGVGGDATGQQVAQRGGNGGNRARLAHDPLPCALRFRYSSRLIEDPFGVAGRVDCAAGVARTSIRPMVT